MIFSCNRSVQSPAVVERRKATTGFMLDCCTLRRRGFQIGATVRAESRGRALEKATRFAAYPSHGTGAAWVSATSVRLENDPGERPERQKEI